MISIALLNTCFCLNISSCTFLEEPIDSGDGRGFVVASEDVNSVWIFNFIGVKQANGLNALSTPIDIIAQE